MRQCHEHCRHKFQRSNNVQLYFEQYYKKYKKILKQYCGQYQTFSNTADNNENNITDNIFNKIEQFFTIWMNLTTNLIFFWIILHTMWNNINKQQYNAEHHH